MLKSPVTPRTITIVITITITATRIMITIVIITITMSIPGIRGLVPAPGFAPVGLRDIMTTVALFYHFCSLK